MACTDRRIAKTRRAIADAFWALMQTRDFRDITVNDAAARAEISRTTFYHHYKDKFDWLEQTIVAYLEELTADYQLTDLQDRNAVIHNLTEMFHRISSNPQMCTLIQANENSQLMYKFFRNNMMDKFHALRGPDAQLSPEEDLTVHYIAASTSALVEWWVRNNSLFSPEHLARCIYSFHHSE